MRGKRTAVTLGVLAALGLLGTAATAGATITPVTKNAAGAQQAVSAIVGPNLIVGSSDFFPAPPNQAPTVPPQGNPVATTDSATSSPPSRATRAERS